MSDRLDRHVVQGDLDWLEYAIADHVAKYGEHLTGRPYDGNIAGIPCAVANMAMSVIRKNIVGQWSEPPNTPPPPPADAPDPGLVADPSAW